MVNGNVLGRENGQYEYKLETGINKITVLDEYGNEAEEEITYEEESLLDTSVANAPILQEGMKAIYWNGDAEVVFDKFSSSMYNYIKPSEAVENTESRWANAKTEDGSYWVWIPRYAYKVTYYTDSSKTIVSEIETEFRDIDVLFLRNKTNEYENILGEINALPEGYKVHRAFTSSSSNGGWSGELAGIWVSKYEMSREDSVNNLDWLPTENEFGGGNALTTNAGNNDEYIRVVSKPGMKAWTGIEV